MEDIVAFNFLILDSLGCFTDTGFLFLDVYGSSNIDSVGVGVDLHVSYR